MRSLRWTVALSLAGTLAGPATPAPALSALVIEARMSFPQFPQSFNGRFLAGTATGTVVGRVLVLAPVDAEYGYTFAGATCPATAAMDGTLHLAGNDFGFHMQLIGAVAVIAFDTGGVMVGALVPLGVPSCDGSTGHTAELVATGFVDVT